MCCVKNQEMERVRGEGERGRGREGKRVVVGGEEGQTYKLREKGLAEVR